MISLGVSSRFSKLVASTAILVIMFGMFASTNVFAALGYCGTEYCWGYFTGIQDKSGADGADGNVINGGVPGSVNSTETLIAQLKSWNRNGTAQNKTGSAFIVSTMLGLDPPGHGKAISDADWADLTARIKDRSDKGKVNWNSNHYASNDFSGNLNSFYQRYGSGPNPDDDAYYVKPKFDPAIEFFDDSGNTIYVLYRQCANPSGGLLPPAKWSIAPTASVQSTANIGDTVTWSYTVTNTGPLVTDKAVEYGSAFSDQSGGSIASYIKQATEPSGWQPGASYTKTYTSTYVIKPNDKIVCRVAGAHPGAYGSTAWVYSSPACVTISAMPQKGVCRPMKIHVDGIIGAHTHPSPSTQSGRSSEAVNTPIPIHMVATSVDDSGNPISHTFPDVMKTSDVDVTIYCTTGTEWTFHIYTDEYTSTHYNECLDWYHGRCLEWEHNSTNSKFDTTIKKGPCFDYTLATEVKNLAYYQVEPEEVIDITPLLTSDSWTRINDSSFYNAYLSVEPSLPLHTKTKSTQWQVSMLIVNPGDSVPSVSNKNSSKDPCRYYQDLGSIASCQALASDGATYSGKAVFSKDSTPNTLISDNSAFAVNQSIQTIKNFIAPDLDAGTKVCFAFSVSPVSSDANTPYVSNTKFEPETMWNHSALIGGENGKCIIIVKKPKFQVWGGDVSVGKTFSSSAGFTYNTSADIKTTTSVKSGNRMYGSWVEYGIYATGSVSGTASSSAFAGGNGLTVSGAGSANTCDYSDLSFTNTDTLYCSTGSLKGKYNPSRSIPDVEASFSGAGSNISNADALNFVPNTYYNNHLGNVSANGVLIVNRTGNVNLNASNLEPGRSIIMKIDGDVTISGDQTYNPNNKGTGYTGISQLPQLVIIANNINIDNDVFNIDAWLIANGDSSGNGGRISTCTGHDDDDLSAKVDMCGNTLVVNGPVMASTLYLRRTAGSGVDTNSGDPAEVFNLRADTYLWAYARATDSGKIQTVYTTELPPRF